MSTMAGNISTNAASSAPVLCAHCSLPVPAGLITPNMDRQFCCSGCRTVFEVISSCGLDNYYRLRRELETENAPARTTGRKFEEFDNPTFAGLYCHPLPAGLMSIELYLEGVHCAACVWLVEKLPTLVPGCVEAHVNLGQSLVRVIWDPTRTPLSAIARALDRLGYPPHPARDRSARSFRRREDRDFLIRIAVAGACAGNSMLLAFALYSGAEEALESQYGVFFRWLSMVLGLLSIAWPGRVFFKGAWAAIWTRTPHLDLPISIGLLAGAVSGTVHTFIGGHIYFDSLTVLVFLLLVGRWIQRRQQRSAADALELLFSLTPNAARVVDPETGVVRETPVEAVQPGALLEVRAGDSIPADGVVESGTSAVDQSLLTGESRPVAVQPGSQVCAGTTNSGGLLRFRASAAGAATRLGKLMRLVEESAHRRAPLVRLADRLAGQFVVVVSTLAVLTVAVWLWIEPRHAVDNAAALLIVTCPCALGLATPLALSSAIARAARRRILIKGGDALEQLTKPGLILLDKTGTLTQGQMALVRWVGDESLRPDVAALERHSAHPIARALSEAPITPITTGDSNAPLAAEFAGLEVRSNGILANWNHSRLAVGSPEFARALGAALSRELEAAETELIAAALTPVRVVRGERVVALAGLGDPLRVDSAYAVTDLQQRGWRVRILSGDHPAVVQNIGRQLGLPEADCIGGATPEQKLACVEAARRAGPVVMVGDGVNDAAALAAATVGIAVHGGAEASLAAADVYLARPGLTPIVELLTGARRTLRTMKRGLGISLFYNFITGGLAITGLINPLIAALLMPISSLSVLGLALSSRSFRE